MQVEILCNRCARKYNKALGIPTRMECSACGGDILTPAEPLVLCDRDTREELAEVPAGEPFHCYTLKVPKVVILKGVEKKGKPPKEIPPEANEKGSNLGDLSEEVPNPSPDEEGPKTEDFGEAKKVPRRSKRTRTT